MALCDLGYLEGEGKASEHFDAQSQFTWREGRVNLSLLVEVTWRGWNG